MSASRLERRGLAPRSVLGRWRLRSIKESPQRRQSTIEALTALGLEVRDLYMTLGQYDLVAVYDAPDDEAVARAALHVASQGVLTSETMRAFSTEETDRLIGSLA